MTFLLLLAVACGLREAEGELSPPGPTLVASEGLAADRAATTQFFQSRPRYEQPLDEGLKPVPGLPDLSAETCGTCHPALYAEWSVSTHAAAWTDPQFQAEIGKSGNRWLCLNCHTPLLVQHDLWPRGLTDGDVELPVLAPNPAFDPKLREEGITCAGCHVRDGAIHGPGLGGDAPHPVVADATFRTSEQCERCHQAEAVYPGKSFVCTFQTGDEWRAGPWDERGKTCQTCHMPEVERPAATGAPARVVRQHWWRGAGIPKFAGVHPPPEANPPGLDVQASPLDDRLQVTLTNANAGHMLPSGDPERWIQVDVSFIDAGGQTVGTWSHRIGQTWEWTSPPKKIADNRLEPEEGRVESLVVPEGAVHASITASSHRISKKNADYHHLGDYPRSVVTHQLEIALPDRARQ